MSVVRLRLACRGQRNRPFYHIVAINVRKARDAKPIEKLGEYDPIPKPLPENPSVTEKRITWDADRIQYWLGVGAQPSPTVARLLEMRESCSKGHQNFARCIWPEQSKLHLGWANCGGLIL
ncbi:ribosomal s16 domain-containing protein [Rhizoctonia solani AG-1 IA]|uniref:Ribosomal s16 domain-containing protein n=1 Tax=Thanatephorus cucumeris (strain AG1-IA) TaxID=983506 RepID=L8WX66_THACA|nr:ribosomal s16 domain-containing protein [Rhizoctonia solani AG-1 IA]